MSSLAQRVNADWLRRFAPLALAFAIIALSWLLFVRPRQQAARRASAEVAALQPRVAELSPMMGTPRAPSGDAPAADVIRRLPQVDPMPDVLERLSGLALVGMADGQQRLENLLIETGEQTLTGGERTGPQPTHGSDPDPRVALFGVRLAYTRVTVSFESSYARLGKFLWDMRELPTAVEVHSLEVEPASSDGSRLRTSMVLFVFRRAGQSSDAALTAGTRGPA